jgi:hypothetical protein
MRGLSFAAPSEALALLGRGHDPMDIAAEEGAASLTVAESTPCIPALLCFPDG